MISVAVQIREESVRYPNKYLVVLPKILSLISVLKTYNFQTVKVISPNGGDIADIDRRVLEAFCKVPGQAVLRVCGDSYNFNINIARWCADVWKLTRPDYLVTYGYPEGENIEIIRHEALVEANKYANQEEQEHVTLYIERHPEKFTILRLPALKTSVDYKEELELLKKYYG